MKRSLRRLAFLGLLALGASSAGAQVLFNMTYNPSELKLTITPTSANAGGNLPAGNTVFPMAYGMLFKNFFTTYPTGNTSQSGEVSTSLITGGLKAQTQSDPSASFNTVWDDGANGRGLSLLAFSSATSTMNPSSQAFNSGNSLTITFTSGIQNFMPTSGFSGAVNVFNDASSQSGGYDIGTYSYSVVPEPSTYAAIAGALGLGYAIYRRRRQAAATPATA
jgi:hypothetical protein